MKSLFFIVIITIAGNVFAQTPVETYKGLLLSLEQNINYKPFKKAWKKERTTWEESVNTAKTVKDLTIASIKFTSKVYEVKGVKTPVIATENLKNQTTGLKTVASLLKEDGLSGWSGLEDWNKKADDFIAKEQQKEDEKRQMQRFQFISAVVKDFEKYFPAVFEDAKKGSFANTIEGKELVKDGQRFYKVKPVFTKGNDQIVTIDEDNIYTFHFVYQADGDVEIAQKILEELVNYLKENLPDGFVQTNMFDGKYIDKNRYVFEYKGESFSDTAKRPSISIGRLKNVPNVIIEITEPVFKR